MKKDEKNERSEQKSQMKMKMEDGRTKIGKESSDREI